MKQPETANRTEPDTGEASPPPRKQHADRHSCGGLWVGGVCSRCGDRCDCTACKRGGLPYPPSDASHAMLQVQRDAATKAWEKEVNRCRDLEKERDALLDQCEANGASIGQLTEALARAEAKVARLYTRGADTTSALRDERSAMGNLSVLSVAVVEDCDAEYARLKAVLVLLYDAAAAYFEHNGAEHETAGCPEDDTCECPLVNAVNEAFAAALRLVENQVSTPEKPAVQP